MWKWIKKNVFGIEEPKPYVSEPFYPVEIVVGEPVKIDETPQITLEEKIDPSTNNYGKGFMLMPRAPATVESMKAAPQRKKGNRQQRLSDDAKKRRISALRQKAFLAKAKAKKLKGRTSRRNPDSTSEKDN